MTNKPTEQKPILVTKVLPDRYGVGVIPEMEKPTISNNKYWTNSGTKPDFELLKVANELYSEHLASLPTFLVHPSLNPKEGQFIEQGREGWETKYADGEWGECSEDLYLLMVEHLRRKVLLPLVKKKEDETPEYFERSGETYIRRDVVEERLMISYVKKLLDDGRIKILNGNEDFFKTIKGKPTDLFLSHITPPEGNTAASEQGEEDLIDTVYEIEDIDKLRELLIQAKKGSYQWCKKAMELSQKVRDLQSPPSLQEREKGIKWVKASERLPDETAFEDGDKWKLCATNFGGIILSLCYYDHADKKWYGATNVQPEERVAYWMNLIEPSNESEDTAKQSK